MLDIFKDLQFPLRNKYKLICPCLTLEALQTLKFEFGVSDRDKVI